MAGAVYELSHLTLGNTLIDLFSFTKENWGAEGPNALSKILKHISSRANIYTRFVMNPEYLISMAKHIAATGSLYVIYRFA